MSQQEYIALPIHAKEAARVKKALEEWVREHEGEAYHSIKDPIKKEEIGMMIHDLNAVTSKIDQPQYKLPWDLLETLLYPNAGMREIASNEQEAIKYALNKIGIEDGAWSIRTLEVLVSQIVIEIKKRYG